MQTIHKILLTTDFSETSQTAFGLAQQVAAQFEAQVVLLHVLDVQLPPLVFAPSGAGADQLEQKRVEGATTRLAAVARTLAPDAESIVASGIPHIEIVRYAEDNAIDLIIMATHGRGFFSHAIMGSTTERVIRRAPCPVLSVRDNALQD